MKDNTQLRVCTSGWLKAKVKNCIRIIERNHGQVVYDTCAMITWSKNVIISSVLTNSPKTAYYNPAMNRVDTFFGPVN